MICVCVYRLSSLCLEVFLHPLIVKYSLGVSDKFNFVTFIGFMYLQNSFL